MLNKTCPRVFQNRLFCAVLLLVIGFLNRGYAQTDSDDKFPVKDCRGRSAGICLKGECTCDEWQIQLLKKDGREWGLITGKTLESVQRQLKKNQDFDRQYARFFNESVDDSLLNYQRPSEPICRVSCPTGSTRHSLSDGKGRRRDEISDFIDDLQDKVIKETARVTLTLANIERKGANPFKSVGFVLRDYTNTLRDVLKRQKELRAKLASISEVGTTTISDIEAIYRDSQAVENRFNQANNQLPENARKLLETGEMPSVGGAWNEQRIRDFDNSVTRQTIEFNQNRITVSLKSEAGAKSSVTYSLLATDIVPQSISVQSTDVPDHWMVTFNTNGRKIVKRTNRETNSLSDNVSKMSLFFSSEEAARAAEEALRSTLP